MKNKKFTIGLVLFITASMALTTSCTKGKTNPEPTQDTEIATSGDRVMLEMIASDMGEIIAQGCDGGSAWFAGNVGPSNSFPFRNLFFSNTMGYDGHMRSGTFQLDESTSFPGSSFYRNPGYVAKATVTGFILDTYTVTVNTFSVVNTTPNGWTLGKDLTWDNTYDFIVTKPDGSQLSYKGVQKKILAGYPFGTSTNTTAVITGTTGTANSINWTKSNKVGFYGTATGMIAGESYTSTVTQDKMLIRDYTCAPERINPPSLISRNERHPFINGIMMFGFTGGSKHERTINLGNSTCDYNIKVTIDEITYDEDVNW